MLTCALGMLPMCDSQTSTHRASDCESSQLSAMSEQRGNSSSSSSGSGGGDSRRESIAAVTDRARSRWEQRVKYEALAMAEAATTQSDPLPPCSMPTMPAWPPEKLVPEVNDEGRELAAPPPASTQVWAGSLFGSLRQRIHAHRKPEQLQQGAAPLLSSNGNLTPAAAIDELKQVHMGHEMLAGSIASVVSRFCVAPFDVLKIRFQIQEQASHQRQYTSVMQAFKSIYKKEGIRVRHTREKQEQRGKRTVRWGSAHSRSVLALFCQAFWKGNAAAELMVVPYGAVSFLAYSTCKSWFPQVVHAKGTFASYQHLSSLVAGSFAGLCATISTYPLDLLRTRFAAQQQHKVYRSLLHAATHIVEREGIGGLYTGMTPTLIGIVPLMAIQFGSYEAFKQAIRNAKAEPGVDPNTLPLTFIQQVRQQQA